MDRYMINFGLKYLELRGIRTYKKKMINQFNMEES